MGLSSRFITSVMMAERRPTLWLDCLSSSQEKYKLISLKVFLTISSLVVSGLSP